MQPQPLPEGAWEAEGGEEGVLGGVECADDNWPETTET